MSAIAFRGNQWIQRFDVAKLLENALDMSYWKGEDCTKGVFFTDEYGYSLNKVLAIRVKHDENAPEVFYSFNERDDDDHGCVVRSYPYKELSMLPRKHHLLFAEEEVEREHIDDVFVQKEVMKTIQVEPSKIAETIEKQIPNKRQRDRTQLVMKVRDGEVHLETYHKKKKEVTFSEIIKYDTITTQDILDFQSQKFDLSHWEENEKSEEEEIQGIINAHTLCYLLHVFRIFNSVIFQFAKNKVFITGNPNDTNVDVAPKIEVVVSLMKL